MNRNHKSYGGELKNKPHVVIVAYAIEPNSISEPHLAWETVASLAQTNKITVVTRKNNIEKCRGVSEDCGYGIRWIGVDANKIALKLKKLLKGAAIQPYALLWQFSAAKAVKELGRLEHIDIVHGLSMMTIYNFSAGLTNFPSVIGPIGGAQRIPRAVGISTIQESIRSLSLLLLPVLRPWAAAMRRAKLILVANEETRMFLVRNTGCSVNKVQIRQPGLPPTILKQSQTSGVHNSTNIQLKDGVLQLFWGSRLVRWKGLELLLYGCKIAKDCGASFHLHVTGWGSDSQWLERTSERLGLCPNVTFHGMVSSGVLEALRSKADILCFTSLRETTGLALLEMLNTGKPVMVVKTGGPREITDGLPCISIRPSRAVFDIAKSIKFNSETMPMDCGHRAEEVTLIQKRICWISYIRYLCSCYSGLEETNGLSWRVQ